MGRPLDLLVNNAGRFLDAPFQLTEDGFEQVEFTLVGRGGLTGVARLGFATSCVTTASPLHTTALRAREFIKSHVC
jgi:hypothetical protein